MATVQIPMQAVCAATGLPNEGETVGLWSCAWKKWLSVDSGILSVTCKMSGSEFGPQESFRVARNQSPNQIAFISHYKGHFLSFKPDRTMFGAETFAIDATINTNAGENEWFAVEDQGLMVVALRSRLGKYWSCDDNNYWNAAGVHIGDWEKFYIIRNPAPGGPVVMKTENAAAWTQPPVMQQLVYVQQPVVVAAPAVGPKKAKKACPDGFYVYDNSGDETFLCEDPELISQVIEQAILLDNLECQDDEGNDLEFYGGFEIEDDDEDNGYWIVMQDPETEKKHYYLWSTWEDDDAEEGGKRVHKKINKLEKEWEDFAEQEECSFYTEVLINGKSFAVLADDDDLELDP